jgi:mannose-1-phosphate guanylyltransferase
MLQEAILRLNGLDDLTDPIIICNTDYRFLVKGYGFKAPIK